MDTGQPMSDVEQKFQVALERTAEYHYKLALQIKAFRALNTYRNTMRPIRESYDIMLTNRRAHRTRDCFQVWLSITRDIQRTREHMKLAEQFHCSILAALVVDIWKQFAQRQKIDRQQMVSFKQSLVILAFNFV